MGGKRREESWQDQVDVTLLKCLFMNSLIFTMKTNFSLIASLFFLLPVISGLPSLECQISLCFIWTRLLVLMLPCLQPETIPLASFLQAIILTRN